MGVLGLFMMYSGAALAQTTSAGPKLTNLGVGKPEGLPPPYVTSADCLYPADPDQAGSFTANTYTNITLHVLYLWSSSSGDTYRRDPVIVTTQVYYSVSLGAFPLHLDLTLDPGWVAMTPNGLQASVFGQAGINKTDTGYPALYELGVTLFKVSTTTGAAVPAGAVVTMSNYYGPVAQATVHDGKAVFGQPYYTKADSPYPWGMASDYYTYSVTAPAYSTCTGGYYVGNTFPGQTIAMKMAPAGTASPAPTAAPTTDADNPDAPPGTGTGSSSPIDLSTLNNFVGSFFDKLKQLMIDLFTPAQADVDAVKTAANLLFTWGPFGLAGQVKAQWDAAAAGMSADNSDPTYWYFPLNMGALTPLQTVTTPQGYTPQAERGYHSDNNVLASRAMVSGEHFHYETRQRDQYGRYLKPSAVTTGTTAMDVNMWVGLIPDHWDCRPYSTPILIMRGLFWAAAWLGFGFYLRNKFTPDLKV